MSTGANRPPRNRRALGAAVVVLVASLAGISTGCSQAPRRLVVELGAELAFEESRWNVMKHPDGAPPRSEVLTPSILPVEGAPHGHGDLPAIVLVPNTELRIPIRADDGDCVLRAHAGIDFRTAQRVQQNGPPLEVRFVAQVDAEVVFDETIRAHPERALEERYWRPVGGEAGVALEPGDVLVLRTELIGTPRGVPAAGMRLGFGGMQLERRRELPLERATRDQPNIVLVVMDTLRADRLGCYGYDRPTSPNLDALAERGWRFGNAHSTSSWTWPATASLLTGLEPETHGVTSNDSCYLSGSLETLPEVLQRHGYATAAFSGNDLIVAEKNFDQGFAHFDGAKGFRKTDELLPAIRSKIDELAPGRFFLYLHLVDTHTPHAPTREATERLGLTRPEGLPEERRGTVDVDPLDLYARELLQPEHYDASGALLPEFAVPGDHARFLSDSYDAAVATADAYVGEILDHLDAAGLTENTLVVFTSDHGEELLDHGLLAHGHTVHHELVRVPLIAAWPDGLSALALDELVSIRRLAPTLAWIGSGRASVPAEGEVLFGGPSSPARDAVAFSTAKGWWNGARRTEVFGLRTTSHVLHWAPDGAGWGGVADEGARTRLFDLRADADELRDLAADEADTTERLLALLRARVERARDLRTSAAVGAGAATAQGLQDIGYFEADDE